MTDYAAVQWWVGHYEGKLPRRENYKKKTLVHLERMEKKLSRYMEAMQHELTRFPDSVFAKAFMTVCEYHRAAALLAIAAKTQRAA